MKLKLTKVKNVPVTGEYIRLDAFLKFAALVPTGGSAKLFIQSGEVFVNGQSCDQRGRKLRDGNIVRFGGLVYRVACMPDSP